MDRCCALAQRMATRLGDHDHVRILNDVVLNQVLVQFGPPGGDDASAARLTTGVIERVQDGRYVLGRRNAMAWAGGDAHLDFELDHHRRGHRSIGGRDPVGAGRRQARRAVVTDAARVLTVIEPAARRSSSSDGTPTRRTNTPVP